MSTSIVYNGQQTVIGYNFDNFGFKYKILKKPTYFYLSIMTQDGWIPICGANSKGQFYCISYIKNPLFQTSNSSFFLDKLCFDYLLNKYSFKDLIDISKTQILSNRSLNYSIQAQICNKKGEVLMIIPNYKNFYESNKKYYIHTNFYSNNKESELDLEQHIYGKVEHMLKDCSTDFNEDDCFTILKNVSDNKKYKTSLSLVFIPSKKTIFWTEENNDQVKSFIFQ